MVYVIVRRVFDKFWDEWVALIILCCISIYTTRYVTINSTISAWCNLYRVAILICFYQFGVVYRKYLEKWYEKMPGIAVCMVEICFIAIFNGVYGYNEFYFNSLSWSVPGMEQFVVMVGLRPIITGVIGILFWLKISQALVPVLENNRFINFISNHTFDIMFNHIVFIWGVNLILVKLNDIIFMDGFDTIQAVNNPWYRWCNSNWSNLIYFFAGLFGALILAWVTDHIKQYTKKVWNEHMVKE